MTSLTVRACPIARTLDVVGEKWSLLVIREMLSFDNHRFEDFVRFTGAPRDVLTARLRSLEERGLVRREQYQEHPPRFEYHLTEVGQSLRPVIDSLYSWGTEHLPAAPVT